MRVLLSTIGSRGDVQPLVALAERLRAHGQEVSLCVPPDFREWIEGLGFLVTPIGPELRKLTAANPAASMTRPTPEQLRQMVEGSVATQFETIARAARGCDLMVGATALQIAAPSVAELLGIPYVFVAYCPRVLPSAHHAPIPLGMRGQVEAPADADTGELWARDAARLNETFGGALNAHRKAAGLSSVGDVRSHIFTERPWLAADPTLAPWPGGAAEAVFQPGAWMLDDERPLPSDIERFLDAGEPPVYFGFGSMRAPADLGLAMIGAARALGKRAIVSRGWADIAAGEAGDDCLTIDDVNHRALFRRVAAVVHHGGAGTTASAAFAGSPQVVIPQMYDQHYWAGRVEQLGVGTAHATGAATADSLATALVPTLGPRVAERARAVAREMLTNGADVAARRLISLAR